MKRLLILLFIVLNLMKIQAQHIIVAQGNHSNVVYFGLKNPIAAFVDNTPCKKIELMPSQGKIYKNDKCNFIYEADSIGVVTISIYKNVGHKRIKVGENYFRIIEIPKPKAILGIFNNCDTVFKNNIKVQRGVRVEFMFNLEVDIKVNKFNIIILRNDSVIFSEANKGALFSENAVLALYNLQTNDKVILSGINVAYVNKICSLDPLEYIIKE